MQTTLNRIKFHSSLRLLTKQELFGYGDSRRLARYLAKEGLVSLKPDQRTLTGQIKMDMLGPNISTPAVKNAIDKFNKDERTRIILELRGNKILIKQKKESPIKEQERSEEEVFDDFMLKAAESLSRGGHRSALSFFDKALEICADNQEALEGKARCHRILMEYEKAINTLLEALKGKCDPDRIRAALYENYLLYARERFEWGYYPRTLSMALKALELFPNSEEALKMKEMATLKMAERNAEKGNHNTALELYDGVLEINPRNEEALVGKGESLIGLKSFNEARISFAAATRLNSRNIAALLGIGRALIFLDDIATLNSMIKEHLKHLSLDPAGALLLSLFLAEKADDITYLSAMEFLEKKDALQSAISFARKLVKRNPNNSYVWKNLGFIFFKHGRHNEALTAFLNAVFLSPSDSICHLQIGFLYDEKGEKDNALEHLFACIKIERIGSSRRFEAIKLAADIIFSLDLDKELPDLLEEKLENNQVKGEILFRIIQKMRDVKMHRRPRNNELFIVLYEKLIEWVQDDKKAYSQLLWFLKKVGDLEKAERVCAKAIDLWPDEPKLLYRRAGLFLERKDYRNAIVYFNKLRDAINRNDPLFQDSENAYNYLWSLIRESEVWLDIYKKEPSEENIQNSKKLLSEAERIAEIIVRKIIDEVIDKRRDFMFKDWKFAKEQIIKYRIAIAKIEAEDTENLESALKELRRKKLPD